MSVNVLVQPFSKCFDHASLEKKKKNRVSLERMKQHLLLIYSIYTL